ncbi:MAG TPA: hypothetical protein VHO01_00140 [Jatrophihabitans sp.]|nr:hypothetical protein [Jatrophihabitans sp.]
MAARNELHDGLRDVVRRHLRPVAEGVWSVPSGAPVRRFIDELSASTRERVITLNPGNFPPGESMSKGAVWDERSLQRGIEHRTVVGAPRSFSADDRQYCRWLTELGAQVRWNPACSARMIAVDGLLAMVRAVPDEPASDAIVLTHPSLLVACQDLFDALWRESRPLEDGFLAEPDHDDIDRALLQLLAAGATDAQVARALEMSPRQVGRRIARLAAELGAVGRFALGAAAQRRGWLG